MIPVATIAEPYTIGRVYRVPCVFATAWQRAVPIIGPLHEDKEHINFPEPHWHIDWRFVSKADYHWYSWQGTSPVHSRVISQKNTAGPIVERRMKCKRPMPEFPVFPYNNKPVHWLRGLQDAYADTKLKCGMICPHRGMPLAGCPVTDGVVICPAHGLAWDVESGAMVRRVCQNTNALAAPTENDHGN